MFESSGNNISMCVGDWGVELPITISGVTLGASDSLKITIANTAPLIVKEYDNITQNTIRLVLTEAESALLPVGTYVYSLDWYQDGSFLCNIIKYGLFLVGDKA